MPTSARKQLLAQVLCKLPVEVVDVEVKITSMQGHITLRETEQLG